MANKGTTPGLGGVAIPLPPAKKNMVQIGCICMMLSVAMSGLAFATLTSPILESVNAVGYVSLFSIFAGLGVSIMTPIGGKLGDLIGRRNIVVIPGIICAVCIIAFSFARSLAPLMALRLAIGFAQGAFTAAPYIIVNLINERKDVPKAMGFLATAIAVGQFGGSMLAGFLTDMGLLNIAILTPAIPLIIGVILIGLNMPNQKRTGKVTLDVPGIIALVITLCGILLALNFGSSIGWTNPGVVGGFVVGIIALVILIMVERKAAEPLIPLRLFSNKLYSVLLIVGFICYFYQPAMQNYGPLAAIRVLGQSTTIAGSLMMPRTIITMILPAIAGTWVAKKAGNAWKAMVIATMLVVIPMVVAGFTTYPGASIMIYFVAFAVTGISESFRAVAITPTAQTTLLPEDMGVGTSLATFVNSLSTTIAAAVFGVAYNLKTAADPTDPVNIQSGVSIVYMVAAVVTLVGFLLVIFFIRPWINKREKEGTSAS